MLPTANPNAFAHQAYEVGASPAPVAPVQWVPLDLGSKLLQFHVSDSHLAWSFKNGASGGTPWSDIRAIKLDARLSWGQAVLWYVLFALVALGASTMWIAVWFLVMTIGAIGNLVLRRRYVLTLSTRTGPITLYLGAGYPAGPVTLRASKWLASLMQGYGWLKGEAQRRGITAA